MLAVGLTGLITSLLTGSSDRGKLRLLVGTGTPAISLGDLHGIILASDGSLWSWGSEKLGWPVLGLGGLTNRSSSLRRIGEDTNWVSISAGASHNLAIKSDGTLWTWGQSKQDHLTRPRPIPAPALAAPGNDWKQAAAGGVHSVALKKDGTLWGWGNNWAGRLGIAPTNGSAVPVRIGSDTNWTRVWAGNLTTVAMQSDGSLWCWGDFPNPEFRTPTAPIPAPMRISPDTNWVDAGLVGDTAFAIKPDGTLWVWGNQAHMFTEASDAARDAVPTRVGTNADWKALSACTGGYWWCPGLIKKDGSLWLMETTDPNPNGPSKPYPPVRFRRAAFQGEYVAYAGGAFHLHVPGPHLGIGVALTANGEVWTWGAVLGEPLSFRHRAQALGVKLLNYLPLRKKIPPPYPYPLEVFREEPWRLHNE